MAIDVGESGKFDVRVKDAKAKLKNMPQTEEFV
jgi:hypothetical protein